MLRRFDGVMNFEGATLSNDAVIQNATQKLFVLYNPGNLISSGAILVKQVYVHLAVILGKVNAIIRSFCTGLVPIGKINVTQVCVGCGRNRDSILIYKHRYGLNMVARHFAIIAIEGLV